MILKIILIILIFLDVFILFFILCNYITKKFTEAKCRYWKVCKYYDASSITCNKDSGWYGSKRPGCYIEMEEIN